MFVPAPVETGDYVDDEDEDDMAKSTTQLNPDTIGAGVLDEETGNEDMASASGSLGGKSMKKMLKANHSTSSLASVASTAPVTIPKTKESNSRSVDFPMSPGPTHQKHCVDESPILWQNQQLVRFFNGHALPHF